MCDVTRFSPTFRKFQQQHSVPCQIFGASSKHIRMIGGCHFVRTCLQQWELPASPLQEAGVKRHPGFSGSGLQSPWGTAGGLPGTPTGENSAPCGTLLQTRCLASAGAHLWKRVGPWHIIQSATTIRYNHEMCLHCLKCVKRQARACLSVRAHQPPMII